MLPLQQPLGAHAQTACSAWLLCVCLSSWFQQQVNRGFFYVWCDKIGTQAVAGNYAPSWTGAEHPLLPAHHWHEGCETMLVCVCFLGSFVPRVGPSHCIILVRSFDTESWEHGQKSCGKTTNSQTKLTEATSSPPRMGFVLASEIWRKCSGSRHA